MVQGRSVTGRGVGTALGMAAAVLAAGLLSACQTTARLSPEEAAQQARWHPIDVVDVELTVPILIKPRVTAAERRVRGMDVIEDRLTLGIGDGKVDTLYIAEGSVDDASERQLGDAQVFSARMIETFDRRYAGHQQFRPIHHRIHRSAGFAALVDTKDRRKRCVFAIVGYRLKGDAIHVMDFGNVDTVVTMLYCHPGVVFEDFATMLETVDRVEDRAAFSEILRDKANAAPGRFRGGGRAI